MDKTCPKCNAQLDAGTSFCANCGLPINYCNTCGAVADPDTNFCPFCGNQLLSASHEQNQSAPIISVPVDPLATTGTIPVANPNGTADDAITEWTLSSRFLLRLGKKSKINADGPLLQIKKGIGVIFYGIRPLYWSAPIQINIPEISSISINERYSISSIIFLIAVIIAIYQERFLVALIFAIIALSELKFRRITIIHQGQKTTMTDDGSKESAQNLIEYIRRYNPNCIK